MAMAHVAGTVELEQLGQAPAPGTEFYIQNRCLVAVFRKRFESSALTVFFCLFSQFALIRGQFLR